MNTRVKANASVGRDLRARRNTTIKRIFISVPPSQCYGAARPTSRKAPKGTAECRPRTRSRTRTRKNVKAHECLPARPVPPLVRSSHLRNRLQQVLPGRLRNSPPRCSPFRRSGLVLQRDGIRPIFHVQVPWYSTPISIAISIWN